MPGFLLIALQMLASAGLAKFAVPMIRKVLAKGISQKALEAGGGTIAGALGTKAGQAIGASRAAGPVAGVARAVTPSKFAGGLQGGVPEAASLAGRKAVGGALGVAGGIGAFGLSTAPFFMGHGGGVDHKDLGSVAPFTNQPLPSQSRDTASMQGMGTEIDVRNALLEIMSPQDVDNLMEGTRRII